MRKSLNRYRCKKVIFGILAAWSVVGEAWWAIPAEGQATPDSNAMTESASDYDLSWYTIDGGGVMFSTGGEYELSGTIGQPDAGVLANGEYTLQGGFWYPQQTSGTCAVQTTSPGNCALDTRQPSAPNGSSPCGWNAVEITFNDGCNTGSMAAGDFNVTVTPAGTAPAIADVTAVGRTVTIHFASNIPSGKWTCVEHTGSAGSVCLGRLPGDVNGDRTAGPADILSCIDNLNGRVLPPYALSQCDMDCSGVCAPADILRVIDLLNGADTYDPWLGRTLPVCPSAP